MVGLFWLIQDMQILKLLKQNNMFIISDKVYASAGNLLKRGNWTGFSCKISDNIEEVPIIVDDIKLINDMFIWNNGKNRLSVIPNGTYKDYKKRLISKIFSNDDQIALILNKDCDEESSIAFEEMQEWRSYFSTFIKTKINFNN